MTAAPGRLVVVAGPTGTGKTAVALELAARWGGEIVNADSMQLYRGMDIGTAKTPPPDRRGVPHHQLDVLEVTQTASVAAYQRQARAAVEAILAAGRTPLLVGGSGLYVQAVIDEIAFPATDPQVRARLEAQLVESGPAALHTRLAQRDPAAAATIDPGNGRKIVRALEVIELTGAPFTASLPVPGRPRYDALLVHLDRETAELDVALAERVHRMLAAGWLAEVRRLDQAGLRHGRTAGRALGYRQLLDVIDGTATVEQAALSTITATRRFVRRQRSWFQRDRRAVRLAAGDPDLVGTVARLASVS